MFEIMIYWMEPNPAGKWRMRAILPEDRIEDNIKTALDWVKDGSASHFTVNKVDNFDNARSL